MIEETNFVRSYVFLLDHMIEDWPYEWPDQNGTFLSLGGKMAFENLLIFQKETWKPSNSMMWFSFNQFWVNVGEFGSNSVGLEHKKF